MKVVEQNSDRQASAHVYVEGRIAALEEYGQYVDPDDDNAICCYVPIDEGNKAKIRTWFSGTVCIPHPYITPLNNTLDSYSITRCTDRRDTP